MFFLCLVSEDQSLVYKDAVFLSPHKFVGGVGTPGLWKSSHQAILCVYSTFLKNILFTRVKQDMTQV